MMQMQSYAARLQDESELLYMSMIGMVMAAIFATGFHADVDRTLTQLAPEGTEYPFPAHTRLGAAKFTAAIGGFLIGVFFWTVVGKLRWELIAQLLKYRDWIYNPKSLKTRAWYLMLSSLLPRKKQLLTFQHVLPKYPLPKLDDTCAKMLDVVEPLVDKEEFEDINKEMEKFKKEDGPNLQAILEKRYQTEENWVADLWDKYAYLSVRSSLLYTNFCQSGGLKRKDISPAEPRTQTARGANIVYHHLRMYELITSRTLPTLLVQDLVPICCHRYRYLFACNRIPGQAMDDLKTYDSPRHIIIFRKGLMFSVDMYATDETGKQSILSPPEIQTILENIIKETADVEGVQWNPAVFTAQNRTVWAQEREKLLAHPRNSAFLQEVESAIFHLVLEDTKPKDLSEECHANLFGNGFSRWLDKSLTCVIHENGLSGGNVEHATADATLTSRVLEYIWARSKYDDQGNAFCPEASHHAVLPVPSKIDWDLSSFRSAIPKYEETFQQIAMNLDAHALKLNHGKGAIKKLRVSPDSFMQMALQLAFYRMNKKVPKTYETAMTRFFKYGRTETIRTPSKHSLAFTQAMDDPNVPRSECIKHLKTAMAYHHQYKLESMNGLGADRHMFGLIVAAKFAGVKPKLFETKILTDYDQLSTSQAPFIFDKKISKNMDVYPAGGAFSPLRDDGYGVFYLFLGENFTTIHITSYRSCPETDSKLFGEKLLEALEDMKQLLKTK
uniref:Carnitine O-palmitoyltransferase 1, liver isoform-like n=1 Tax=Phallusia mammillata TaxID=59560 RepID=A0A6F9DAR0_9ASCI|nr:carnitine O-palmitoyltransferase 1, liver isoform-like [Phallusia mammillata]